MERRYSKQRECILDVLRATKSHPDADYVCAEVRKSIPNISLGTVYRNLNEMVDRGEILALSPVENRVRYDYDTSPHQHFVCRSCGRIGDLTLESDLGAKAEAVGYRVEGEQVTLYGLCPVCAASEEEQPKTGNGFGINENN